MDAAEKMLVVYLVVMRGGQVGGADLVSDYHGWTEKHGSPTVEKVKNWMADVSAKLQIGAEATNRLLKRQFQQ